MRYLKFFSKKALDMQVLTHKINFYPNINLL